MKKALLITLTPLLLQGCFTPGLDELEALCEKDAGEWYAYDEPVYVEGYFYDNPSDPTPESNYTEISSSGFEYVEVYKPKEHKHSDLEGTGYFRLYKAPKDDPSCNRAFQWRVERKNSDKRPFGRNYCVAVKKIDKPESRYWMSISSDAKYLDNEKSVEIFRGQTTVIDRYAGKEIYRFIAYNLYPSLNHPLAYGTSIPCDQEKYFPQKLDFDLPIIVSTKYEPKGSDNNE